MLAPETAEHSRLPFVSIASSASVEETTKEEVEGEERRTQKHATRAVLEEVGGLITAKKGEGRLIDVMRCLDGGESGLIIQLFSLCFFLLLSDDSARAATQSVDNWQVTGRHHSSMHTFCVKSSFHSLKSRPTLVSISRALLLLLQHGIWMRDQHVTSIQLF